MTNPQPSADRAELREFNIILIKALGAAYKASSTNDLDVLLEGVEAKAEKLLSSSIQGAIEEFAEELKDEQIDTLHVADIKTKKLYSEKPFKAVDVEMIDHLLQQRGVK